MSIKRRFSEILKTLADNIYVQNAANRKEVTFSITNDSLSKFAMAAEAMRAMGIQSLDFTQSDPPLVTLELVASDGERIGQIINSSRGYDFDKGWFAWMKAADTEWEEGADSIGSHSATPEPSPAERQAREVAHVTSQQPIEAFFPAPPKAFPWLPVVGVTVLVSAAIVGVSTVATIAWRKRA